MNRWLRRAGVIALVLMAAPGARAQPRPQPARPLAIPIPGEAKVRMEMDARDDDLLGMVKSFLKGLNLSAMAGALQQGEAPSPPGPVLPPVPPAVGQPPAAGAPSGGMPGGMPAMAQALTNVNLADMLKNIHQMHLVVFAPAEGADVDEIIQFYEKPFAAEGGHRSLWIDADDTKILLMSFPRPRGGMAAVLCSGGDGDKIAIVLRADGYPDLEPVGPMVTMMLPLVRMMASGMGTASEEATDEAVPTPAPPHPAVRRPAPRPTRPHTAVRRRVPSHRPVRRRTR